MVEVAAAVAAVAAAMVVVAALESGDLTGRASYATARTTQ